MRLEECDEFLLVIGEAARILIRTPFTTGIPDSNGVPGGLVRHVINWRNKDEEEPGESILFSWIYKSQSKSCFSSIVNISEGNMRISKQMKLF